MGCRDRDGADNGGDGRRLKEEAVFFEEKAVPKEVGGRPGGVAAGTNGVGELEQSVVYLSAMRARKEYIALDTGCGNGRQSVSRLKVTPLSRHAGRGSCARGSSNTADVRPGTPRMLLLAPYEQPGRRRMDVEYIAA